MNKNFQTSFRPPCTNKAKEIEKESSNFHDERTQ